MTKSQPAFNYKLGAYPIALASGTATNTQFRRATQQTSRFLAVVPYARKHVLANLYVDPPKIVS